MSTDRDTPTSTPLRVWSWMPAPALDETDPDGPVDDDAEAALADALSEQVASIARSVRAAGCRLVACPATVEALSRARAPHGPMARTARATALLLDVEVEVNPSWPEGLIGAVPIA